MIKNTITSHPRTKSPAKFGPQMSYSRCCCVSLYQKFVYLKFRSSLAPENAPTSPPLSEEHMLTVFYEYVCTESSGTCNSVVFNHNSATHSHPRSQAAFGTTTYTSLLWGRSSFGTCLSLNPQSPPTSSSQFSYNSLGGARCRSPM